MGPILLFQSFLVREIDLGRVKDTFLKKKKLYNHQIKGEKKEKIIMELYWEEVTSTPRCYGPYKFQSLQKVQEWNMSKRYVY